jgi:hypothetical protein
MEIHYFSRSMVLGQCDQVCVNLIDSVSAATQVSIACSPSTKEGSKYFVFSSTDVLNCHKFFTDNCGSLENQNMCFSHTFCRSICFPVQNTCADICLATAAWAKSLN